MKLSNTSSVPVYTVSGSSTARSLPEWLSQKRRRTFKNDPEYANRVELLQDFEFEEASHCVRVSDDGDWVMSTGTYKPQIHTHYLPNLSLSWARHTDTINKTFLILSSDYSKTVHLQEDRSIEFHTPGGCHYTMRFPRYGRDLVSNKSSAELLVPSVGVNAQGMGEVFRINLEQGRFMKEYEVEVGGDDLGSLGGGALQGGIRTGSVNTAAVAEGTHNLLAFGTSLGTVEYWDPRSRTRVATLAAPAEFDGRPEITALDFHRSGIDLAVGTSTGLVYLYDLRSSAPTLKKDQGYGFPIKHVQYLTSSSATRNSHAATTEPKVLSVDKRIVKIWDQSDGTPWTSVEPAVDINSIAWVPDSGMFLTANEGRQQHAFFIPQLGPAPRWCRFIDNVVEEMADDPNDPNAFSHRGTGEVYDNYKFLTPPQLRALNLDHLVGKTNLLRPYMHGFFVQQRLYEEARLIANPTSWEEERKKRLSEKIDKERESRIRGKKKVAAKVNRKLAERILEREEKDDRRRAQRVLAQGGDQQKRPTGADVEENIQDTEGRTAGLLRDSRFAALFQNEDFAVDEASREFQLHNPSTKTTVAPSNLDREKGLTAVEEEMVDELPGSSDDESHHENDRDTYKSGKDGAAAAQNSLSTPDYRRRKPIKKTKDSKSFPDELSMNVRSSKASNGRGFPTSTRDRSFGTLASTTGIPTRDRVGKFNRKTGPVGEKVVTFEPGGGNKRKNNEGSGMGTGHHDRDRRGGNRERLKDRRSASGNTFRRM